MLYNGNRIILTRIDNAFMSKLIDGSIEAIVVPVGIKSIRSHAFYNCAQLKSVTLPNGLVGILDHAFFNCTSLETVNIPKGVTTIGFRAFYGCEKLKFIELPSGVNLIASTAFEGCTALSDIFLPLGSGEVDGEGNCWGAQNATVHYITAGTARLDYSGSSCRGMGTNNNPFVVVAALNNGIVIRTIAAAAFKYEWELERVTIQSTLKRVGENAFLGCIGLTSVTFGERTQLEAIGAGAFQNCTKLTNLYMPKSVDSIENGAFENCSALQYVYITDLSEWLNTRFADKTANPLHKGAALFLNGVHLSDLVVPEEVTAIGNYAFYKTPSLQSVTLHDNVTKVGLEAFNQCKNIRKVVLSKNLQTLGDYAFAACSITHDIEIPATVTNIGKRAFTTNAYGMKRVTFKGTPQGINTEAFYSTVITDIYVPWVEGEVANAPWGATNATIHYKSEV